MNGNFWHHLAKSFSKDNRNCLQRVLRNVHRKNFSLINFCVVFDEKSPSWSLKQHSTCRKKFSGNFWNKKVNKQVFWDYSGKRLLSYVEKRPPALSKKLFWSTVSRIFLKTQPRRKNIPPFRRRSQFCWTVR